MRPQALLFFTLTVALLYRSNQTRHQPKLINLPAASRGSARKETGWMSNGHMVVNGHMLVNGDIVVISPAAQAGRRCPCACFFFGGVTDIDTPLVISRPPLRLGLHNLQIIIMYPWNTIYQPRYIDSSCTKRTVPR